MANEISPNTPGISIGYKCTKSAWFSAWKLGKPWLRPGETAKLVDILAADEMNALYMVRRDRDGDQQCVYRSDLLEYGEIEGA